MPSLHRQILSPFGKQRGKGQALTDDWRPQYKAHDARELHVLALSRVRMVECFSKILFHTNGSSNGDIFEKQKLLSENIKKEPVSQQATLYMTIKKAQDRYIHLL